MYCSCPLLGLLRDKAESNSCLSSWYLAGQPQSPSLLLGDGPCFLTSEQASGSGLELQSFDSESSIFLKQCNHHASWEPSMNICWRDLPTSWSSLSYLSNSGRNASSTLQLWTISWPEVNGSMRLQYKHKPTKWLSQIRPNPQGTRSPVFLLSSQCC